MYISLPQFTVSTFISLDPFVSIKLQNINFSQLWSRQWIKLKITDTPRHVLLYTTSYESTSRLRTTRHCRPPYLHSPILLTSAHRFTSPPLTDFAHLCSPNLLTSARELSTSNQRTLTLQPTNTHACSTNIPVSNLKFHTALIHVVSTTFCHSL